jgi:ABC-type spermidine/putrescine transport system permease subunit II
VSCAGASIIVARVIPVLKHRGLVLAAFLAPLFIPGILVGVAIFIYFRVIIGLKLGWWSLYFGHFTWAYPFSLLALLVNTLRFDTRLVEAAGDLGATRWQSFRDVELPLILPGVVSAGMFGFLLSFNDLAHSLLLKGNVQTLPLYEWVQASAHNSNVPTLFSLSTLVMITSMIVVGTAFLILFGRNSD